jgi:RHS repeat-associated protein
VINPNGSSIEYKYDNMGNRTAIIIDEDTTQYTYDSLNRLKTVIDPDCGITSYTYDAVGNRESVIYPNGTAAEYFYDSLNRLKVLLNKKSNGDTISCYTYTLGLSGNRIKVEEHSGRIVDYTYDNTYKLTKEKINDPNLGNRVISYTYDPVGNRLMKIDNSDTTSYSYDANDRLLTENGITYTYDNNGNTLSKSGPAENVSYSYDFQNRLIKVDDGVSVVEYGYDTDGIRVKKTVDGTDVIDYIVDKNRDYAQVLEERDGTGAVAVSYTYGDDLISQKRSSSLSFYHYDGQMSTRQLTNSSGNITDGYTFDAFGVLLDKFGATENSYLYTGEQYDANIGFYYLRARYYNASVGRFLTMDAFPGVMFEPGSLHKYLYCESGPVGRWDPSGNVSASLVFTFSIVLFIGLFLHMFGSLKIINKFYELGYGTEWKGFTSVITFGKNLGIGFIVSALTGTNKKNNPKWGWGLYLTIMGGITLNPFSWLWATGGYGNISFDSPGLLGADPKVLKGSTEYISIGVATPFGGIAYTFSYMGLGFNKNRDKLSEWRGIDCSVDAMWGWTILIDQQP